MGISSLRIAGVDDRPVIITIAFVKNKEVVAMQVHWMGSVVISDVIAKNKPDCLIGAEIVDVPLRVVGVRCVSIVGQIKDRMAVFYFLSEK